MIKLRQKENMCINGRTNHGCFGYSYGFINVIILGWSQNFVRNSYYALTLHILNTIPYILDL